MLDHPSYSAAWTKLLNSAERAQEPGLEGRVRVVIGGAGDGKTKLIRRLETLDWAKPTLDGPEGDIIPIKYVEVPSRVTPKALVSAIATAFGESPPRSYTAENIVDFLVPIFEGVELRLLLLDEAHWLMKGKSEDIQIQNAEFIKSLLNRTKINIILAGVHEIDKLHDYLHDQFRRRLTPKILLKPYVWSSKGERKWFIAIVHHYENRLNLPEKSELGRSQMAARLYLVSRGSLGIVVQYLSAALEYVADRDGSNIQPIDLSQAHRDLSTSITDSIGADPDMFLPPATCVRDDPFLCDWTNFKRLWAKVFAEHKDETDGQDTSRPTRLARGRVL